MIPTLLDVRTLSFAMDKKLATVDNAFTRLLLLVKTITDVPSISVILYQTLV